MTQRHCRAVAALAEWEEFPTSAAGFPSRTDAVTTLLTDC
jgi:hypothetical protein